MNASIIFQTARPSFLILTLACIFLGIATSLIGQPTVNIFYCLLVIIGALFAHISVNMLNEYHDFQSGLDLITTKTAFSGGSGALPKNPEAAKSVLITGTLSLLIVVSIGIYFIIGFSIHILPVGIIGVILIVTYTQWINRLPFLCLISPGMGFGILMIIGTYIILNGENASLPWLISLVPFFLVNNILLLNQYPDIKADASVGRKTFPIAYGLKKSNIAYAISMLAAYLLILIYVVLDIIPEHGVIAILPVIFSIYALTGAIKYSASIGEHPRYLAANVTAGILTPVLLGIAIINGSCIPL